MIFAAMLTVACSQNETEKTSAPEEPIAITFSVIDDDITRASNGSPGLMDKNNNQLRQAGFGVFAGQNADNKPDFMYNQQVKFTFLADEADHGYWSYAPLKYWPTDLTHVYFSAYAPYVETTADLPAETTGIIGMSANNEEPYLDYKLSNSLDETVDLLWTCYEPTVRGTIQLKMYHALTRLAVSVTLDASNTYKTDNNKVLIRRITLSTTKAAKTGRLKLREDHTETIDEVEYHYPTWTDQTTDARTVDIYNNLKTYPASYGIIAEEVRYIDGLSYNWQPKGLQKGVTANALSAEDHHQLYVYFIPYADGLSLTCTVYYTLIDSSGTIHNGHSTANAPVAVGTPLRGNRTYNLNMKINPTP